MRNLMDEQKGAPVASRLLLSVEEAGEVLGVKRSKMYELISAGEIESVKIGKSRRVPVDAVEAYVDRLRAEARSDA